MARTFNTTGPCFPAWHYMLPPEARLPDLLPIVRQNQYFVLHAARQTGKTTAMRAFAARLRELGFVAIWATLEESQGVEDVRRAEPMWMEAIERAAKIQLPAELQPPRTAEQAEPDGTRLHAWLRAWCQRLPDRPVVLLLDEADVVSGEALISLLRQLRAGFMDRGPGLFPVSVGLIGMRDLRDYLTKAKDGQPVNPGSPFNIKISSITLRNFSHDEVRALVQQHTDETGQVFAPEAIDSLFHWTQGQPFLVNALARIAVMELLTDPAWPVTAEAIDQARERLILSRTTHLDSLAVRLKDERVARIVSAVLLTDGRIDYTHDDFQYVVDLGLIRRTPTGAEAANPIYREVLGRQLSYNYQENIPTPRWSWRTADGRLDMPVLVAQFLKWWRNNAAIVEEHADRGYLEAVPHLAFMGFLQKLVNGGGQVTREFAAGRGALDLLVEYAGQRHVIELKRIPPRHRTLEYVREEGLEQLTRYLDELGETEGWLLIFDQRTGKTWEERLWSEDLVVEGKTLHLRGG